MTAPLPASVPANLRAEPPEEDPVEAVPGAPEGGFANDLTRALEGPLVVRSKSMLVIAIILVVGAIHLARPILLPLILAWIAKIVMLPAVRRLSRLGVPYGLSAIGIILLATGLLAVGSYNLAGPAQEWFDSLPEGAARLQERLQEIAQPIGDVSGAAQDLVEKVENAVTPKSSAVQVAVQGDHSTLSGLFSGAQSVVTTALAALALLFFLLVSDEAFLGKIVESLPRLRDKKLAVRTAHAIESNVARYLTSMALINVGLGLAIGLSLWAIGMPNPALWGVMAAVLNFVPYLGPLVGIAVVTAVSLLTFDAMGAVLLAPLFYLGWNILEGMILTPMILGRALTLSPALVFIWFLAWSWLWGVAGALLAVPLLAATKIICDSVPSLQPIGRLIAR